MIKKLMILICIVFSLEANDELKYDKLFFYLEQNNIVLGKDISTEELYEIINENNKNNKSNKDSLINKINKLINYKKSQYTEIKSDLAKNPNSKINKTIKTYLDENNEFVEKAQEDIKEKDEDGWFSKSVNYVLELMKF